MSRALWRRGRPSSPEHRDLAGIPIHANKDAICDAPGRLAGPNDPGDAVFARDDRGVRKQAAVVGDDPAKQREEDVEGLGRRLGDEHVALGDPAELGGPGDAAGGPFVDALARRKAVEDPFLVLRLGATEEVAQGDEDRAHEAADRWRQGREVRRGRRGRAKEGWDVFGGVGRAVFGAAGKLVRGRTTSAGNKRAYLI